MAIDVACVIVLFAAGAVVVVKLAHELGWMLEIEFAFFRNWYSLVTFIAYFALFTWLTDGRTPGKWIVGIRVLSLVHERMNLWHSFERALGYVASSLEFGFGFVQYFIHPNKRTVHDRIAETIVVRVRK